MNKVQEQLKGTAKGDNVASGFIDSLSDSELADLASNFDGKKMLEGLKPHLMSGTIRDSERNQSARIDFAILK